MPGSIDPQIQIIINSTKLNIIGIMITAEVKLSFRNYILYIYNNKFNLTLKLYERNKTLGVVTNIVVRTKGRKD